MKSVMLFAFVSGAITLSAVTASALSNTGFETPDYGTTGWSYAPSGATWGFTPLDSGAGVGAGLSGPGGPWACSSTSPDPLGNQFAFLQRASCISQDMSGLVIGATYNISFFESYRTAKYSGNDLHVILDEGTTNEVSIYVNSNVTNTTWTSRVTDSFVAEKSSYMLTFRATYTGSVDRTTIIDGVSVNFLDPPPLTYVGISNDSNCNISKYKTYTHKLDFGTGTPGALINEVQFDAISSDPPNFTRTVFSGLVSVQGGNTPPGVSGNLANLMRDMYYNGNNVAAGVTTWALSGLDVGETYDLRIYTRQWATGTRPCRMVFDPDGTGTVTHATGIINEDDATTVGMSSTNAPYYINYRFVAVSQEDMVVTVTQYNSNASWHLYGMSCEVVQPTVKTVMPYDNMIGVLPAADLVATFKESVVKGSGNITLRKSLDDSIVEIIDVTGNSVTVNGAVVTINPGSDLDRATGYYVQMDAGSFEDFAGRGCPAITNSTAWNFTTLPEIFTFVHITGDADCDIASHKMYTHKLDFGNGTPGALVNGVQFDPYNVYSNGTLNFTYAINSGSIASHDGNSNHNVSGGLAALMSDMYYNSAVLAEGKAIWNLSGLTPGAHYIARVYTRRWDAGTRVCSMVFDPDGAGPISDTISRIPEDVATAVGMDAINDAYYINYPFTAVAGENLVITVTQHEANNSWHLYGITNERIPPDGTLILVQ